jgi:hypothetical protein
LKSPAIPFTYSIVLGNYIGLHGFKAEKIGEEPSKYCRKIHKNQSLGATCNCRFSIADFRLSIPLLADEAPQQALDAQKQGD